MATLLAGRGSKLGQPPSTVPHAAYKLIRIQRGYHVTGETRPDDPLRD